MKGADWHKSAGSTISADRRGSSLCRAGSTGSRSETKKPLQLSGNNSHIKCSSPRHAVLHKKQGTNTSELCYRPTSST
eukprot:7828533-Pyramimonas_sp.AAC.1